MEVTEQTGTQRKPENELFVLITQRFLFLGYAENEITENEHFYAGALKMRYSDTYHTNENNSFYIQMEYVYNL